MIVYICTKFHENILDGYRANTIYIAKISKGHNSVENVVGVTVHFSANSLMVVYISTKFHKNILDGIKAIQQIFT